MKKSIRIIVTFVLVCMTLAAPVTTSMAYDFGSIYEVGTVGNYILSEQIELGTYLRIGEKGASIGETTILDGELLQIHKNSFDVFLYNKGIYTYYTKAYAEELGITDSYGGQWYFEGKLYGRFTNGDNEGTGATLLEYDNGSYIVSYDTMDTFIYDEFKGLETLGKIKGYIVDSLTKKDKIVHCDGEYLYYVKDAGLGFIGIKSKASGSLYRSKLHMIEDGVIDFTLIDEELLIEGEYIYQFDGDSIYYYKSSLDEPTMVTSFDTGKQVETQYPAIVFNDKMYATIPSSKLTNVYSTNGDSLGNTVASGVINDVVYINGVPHFTFSGDGNYFDPDRFVPVDEFDSRLTNSNTTYPDGSIRIVIDGVDLSIPNDMGAAYIDNGRTMIPLRVISEALGCEVTWDSNSQSIGLVQEDSLAIYLQVGSNKIESDGSTLEMDVACVLKEDGRTYVPLRFVSTALMKNIDYENRGYHYINIY